MKFVFGLLLFILFTSFINAQTDEIDKYLQDINKKAGLAPERKTANPFTLAKSGEVKYVPSVITGRQFGGSAEIISQDAFTYDDKGREATWLMKKDSGAGYVNARLDSSFYNDETKSETIKTYLWEGGAWNLTQISAYEYNENGSLKNTRTEALTDGGWMKILIVYTYTESGLLKQATSYTEENGTAVPRQRYTLNYNAAGDTEEILQEFTQGDVWVNYSQKLYEYNEAGYLISERYSLWGVSDWILNMLTEYALDNFGRIKYELTGYRNGGSVEITDSVAYYYNETGKLSAQVYAMWIDEMWESMDSTAYVYVSGDQYGTTTRFLWSQGDWVKWVRYNYTYNEAGELLSQLIESGIETGDWVNGSKLVYSYDANNNRKKGEYFTWRDGAWNYANGSLDMKAVYHNGYISEAEYIPVDGGIDVEDGNLNPNVFSLAQNYPNPFNPETKISFTLPQSGKASLKIYDMLGREVMELVNGSMSAGQHEVTFSGRDLSSGVYIYRLQSGSFTESKKMALIK